jgi:D-tyrosyl-tRNA(Tyr) deacylase
VRALVQRVTGARVRVGGEVVGEIGPGLCVLVGVTHDDTEAAAARLAEKVWHLRLFDDDTGVMNLPVAAITSGEALVVSQFTLYGDTRRGRRPSWTAAAPPGQAEPLVEAFVAALRGLGATVATGRFGAHMSVELVNDGPVTLMIESLSSRRQQSSTLDSGSGRAFDGCSRFLRVRGGNMPWRRLPCPRPTRHSG